jgi:hypothetical protein
VGQASLPVDDARASFARATSAHETLPPQTAHWRNEGELEQKFNYILGNPWSRWPLPRPLCVGLAQRLKLAQGWREAGFARLRQAGTPVPRRHSADIDGTCRREPHPVARPAVRFVHRTDKARFQADAAAAAVTIRDCSLSYDTHVKVTAAPMRLTTMNNSYA